jgi:amino acid transporter
MARHQETLPGAGRGLFVRQTTGLVREAGLFDTVFFNWIAAGGIGLALVYNVYWALNAFPGVNLIASTLIVVPFAICAVLVFALLAASIPRSGGDYVFVSRILHPVWGFIESWTGFISVVAYIAWVAWFTAIAFIPAAVAVLARSTGSDALSSFANWSTTKLGSFIIGSAIVVLAAAAMIAGLRVALRAITLLAIVGLVGLVLSAAVLAFSDRDDFAAKFNQVSAEAVGTDDAYGEIIARGQEQGLPAGVSSGTAPFASATLPVLVISFYAIGYSVWSIYFAGEIRGGRERRRQLQSMLIPTILNSIVYVSAFALMFKTVGYEFISSSSYLYNYVPDQYPISDPPFIPFFASLLADNAVLGFFIGLAWITWPIAMIFLGVVQFSRMIFAWSFDGVAPAWFAKVNERTHAPVNAIVASSALVIVALILLLQVEAYLTFLAYTVLLALVFWGSMALAGMLLPYRRRELYESGPARWEIGGIPVITIAGALLFLFVVFEFVMVFRYEGLGIIDRGQAVIVTLGVMAVGFGLFGISYLVRRSKGVDPMLVYREIPPE